MPQPKRNRDDLSSLFDVKVSLSPMAQDLLSHCLQAMNSILIECKCHVCHQTALYYDAVDGTKIVCENCDSHSFEETRVVEAITHKCDHCDYASTRGKTIGTDGAKLGEYRSSPTVLRLNADMQEHRKVCPNIPLTLCPGLTTSNYKLHQCTNSSCAVSRLRVHPLQ